MKSLALAAAVAWVGTTSVTCGQGTIASLANSLGATIYPIFDTDGTTKLTGSNYKVQVFLYGNEANPFAVQLGTTVSSIATSGRFNAGSSVVVPGHPPGTIAQLIVRWWDTTKLGGATYETATIRCKSDPFRTDLLGGDPDGDGPLAPITPKGMVTGTADGFRGGWCPLPEPSTYALASVGLAALWMGSRRRR